MAEPNDSHGASPLNPTEDAQGSLQVDHTARLPSSRSRSTYEADAGAGLVQATVNGRGELAGIRIDPKALDDIEMLEDLIKGAVGLARRKAQEAAKAGMAKLTGGFDISAFEQLLGG